MIQIDFFKEVAEACAEQPFVLLPKKEQKEYLTKLRPILEKLKTNLAKKKLEHTHAYQIVSVMLEAVSGDTMDEVRFANALAQLDTLYGQKTNPELMEKVRAMDVFAEKFKLRANEFYLLEERIEKTVKDKTAEEIAAHDLEKLSSIGIFYVLEYTMTVGQELEKLDDAGKKELIEKGKNLEVGNLPGLIPLMDSMRQELAFNLYNKELRWAVLRDFYKFEPLLETDDLPAILEGLKAFNVDLLEITLKGGLAQFTGVFYKPYPDATPIQNIIKDLKS